MQHYSCMHCSIFYNLQLHCLGSGGSYGSDVDDGGGGNDEKLADWTLFTTVMQDRIETLHDMTIDNRHQLIQNRTLVIIVIHCRQNYLGKRSFTEIIHYRSYDHVTRPQLRKKCCVTSVCPFSKILPPLLQHLPLEKMHPHRMLWW